MDLLQAGILYDEKRIENVTHVGVLSKLEDLLEVVVQRLGNLEPVAEQILLDFVVFLTNRAGSVDLVTHAKILFFISF